MAEATPIPPAAPEKPIKGKKWALAAVCVVLALYLVIAMIQGGKPTVKPKAPDQTAANSAATTKETGTDFNTQLNAEANDLLAKRQQMAEAGKNLTSLADVMAHLPPCNAQERGALNGQYFVAMGPNNQAVRLSCDPNDVWTPVPTDAGLIEPQTERQQQHSEQLERGDGRSKKDRLAQARQAALDSSSIALDYTQKAAVPAKRETEPGVEAEGGKFVPVAERTSVAPSEPKPNSYPWDTYSGSLYRIFEGDVIETILTNRLAGEFTGPVNVMVTTNLYSHDRQHIVMPQGTRILGESRQVSMTGQRRLAVVFHRAIMPDGWSVDFDKFSALDQQGASGLTGKVETHWAKLIGTAVLIGAVGGLAQIGNSSTLTAMGQVRLGVGQQTSQESLQILDRMLNVLPTVTIFEGTRVRIWLQKDVELPAYENHTVSPTL